MENYMTRTADTLCEMRLIAEGAVRLLEDEAQMAMPRSECQEAAIALDTIFAALYSLQGLVKQLQADHHNEMLRQDEASVSGGK